MSWNDVKAMVDRRSEARCKPQQVWWAYWGENIGSEQNGRGNSFLRPVIIIQSFWCGLCFAVPLTSGHKKNKHFFPLKWIMLNGKIQPSTALLSQTRTLSTKRLSRLAGYLEYDLFQTMYQRIFKLLTPKKVSAPHNAVPRRPSRGKL